MKSAEVGAGAAGTSTGSQTRACSRMDCQSMMRSVRRAELELQADRSSSHRLHGRSCPGRGSIEEAAAGASARDLGVGTALLDAQRHALQPRRRDGHHRLAPSASSGLAKNAGPQHLGGRGSRAAVLRCA